MIPYGKHNISKEDIEAVVNVLNSDFITQGPMVPNFEAALSNYCNVKHALVTNSCTSALHLAYLSLGLKQDDIVWTSPITFVATVNSAKFCGAKVILVDVDPFTGLIDTKLLCIKLEKAKNSGTLPKVLTLVHLGGQSCDMKEIFRLSKVYGFRVIEDAAHAIGADYQNFKVGGCNYSDITVFSFHPVKIITTGEGGALTTNNLDFFNAAFKLRSHGINKTFEKNINIDGPWYYEQISLGNNYRMTDFQAALGVTQLGRIDLLIESRREIAKWYDENIKLIGLDNFFEPLKRVEGANSSFHLYILLNNSSIPTKEIHKKMIEGGIGVNLHYIPIYKHPFHKQEISLPGAEQYYEKAISIPIFPGLLIEERKKVLDRLLEIATIM